MGRFWHGGGFAYWVMSGARDGVDTMEVLGTEARLCCPSSLAQAGEVIASFFMTPLKTGSVDVEKDLQASVVY